MKTSLLVFGVAGALALVACGGDDPVTSSIPDAAASDSTASTDGSQSDTGSSDASPDASSSDSAASDSASADTGTADAADAGLLPLNGCNTADFVDHSTALDARLITGPAGATPSQYSPPCMKIAAGQSVTWSSAFTSHPLEAHGGSAGNPITTTNTGITKTFAFPTAGVYGFDCANHPGTMFGAILVQ